MLQEIGFSFESALEGISQEPQLNTRMGVGFLASIHFGITEARCSLDG